MSLWRTAALLAFAAASACAATQKVQPTPFKNSDAFKKIRKSALGFLEYDFNRDGVDDVVVVTANAPGMVPQVYVQSPSEHGGVWSLACTGPMIIGEELDTLRWVKPQKRELLLLVASSENPDMLQESFALFPANAPCTPVFQDKVALAKPGYELVSPGEVPGGVLVDDADRVHVIDRAQTVQLRGASGEVDVLKAVRERILDDDGVNITVSEKPRTFVVPIAVETRWRTVVADTMDATATTTAKLVPELSDQNAATTFVVPAGEDGILEITSAAPMVLLDIGHGCGETPSRITLTPETATEDTHELGSPPAQSSFIQGVGHRPPGGTSERRDVVVLRDAATRLDVRVGPKDSERCLRDVRAYGFLLP